MAFESLNKTQQQIYPIVTGLLMSASEPLSEARLMGLLKKDAQYADLKLKDIKRVLDEFSDCLNHSGAALVVSNEGYRLEVVKDILPWVYQLFEQTPPKLSRALLETLAIMAHKQPITRAEVEAVRGVAVSSQIMNQLKQHGWVKSAGSKPVPGHPTLWVTTDKLLQDLGLTTKEALVAQLDSLVNSFLTDKQTQHTHASIH
ncbi:SMC-Scp complex subunit ScpB [Thiomicrospira microaerophila]|uniref:SMC-Scp complex subunit ScpB n=1 Tax=Thiomicrospira microaerophila TaxID=406020 RepID=UPI00200EC43E|nr:SMC-Scp complex subunit ScpB [Thiomicrospira microaerophila]UQB43393.1 SMC-Scp complex subunit ScpB [Thiomicrospira microaerophila]